MIVRFYYKFSYNKNALLWTFLCGGCEGIRTLDLLRDRETC